MSPLGGSDDRGELRGVRRILEPLGIAIGILGLLLLWMVVGTLAYLGMFTCSGAFYESGCDYSGPVAGIVFVVVAGLTGAFCLGRIGSLLLRRPTTRRGWAASLAAAESIALAVLFLGSPWT